MFKLHYLGINANTNFSPTNITSYIIQIQIKKKKECVKFFSSMVVLLYPDISNLDELGNFKQKNFYTSKCKFFLHFKATDPMTSQPE